ncbi:MAG: hypothetical protein KC729_08565, partial [Candidatus Eisenbacteria bacterium]|nr:hypothetical protein [Candidatus Eisenbacteria bacterium]
MSADELTAEVAPGIAYRAFVEAASSCRTEAEFRASRFFRENGEALESVLSKPQIEAHPATRPSGRDDDRLRVVHWNIEKGKELPLIIRRLTTDPVLRAADLYCLNEVDVGMARSGGNAHVARVLAEALGCHSVFVPSYLECTKGPGAEAEAPGENRRGWHGLAILSRIPIESARVVALPHCFDYFDFFEKRFGRRQGLVARIRWQGAPLEVVTTHLEVRNTPACRARQMEALLQGIGAEEPVARVLTG